MVVPIPRILPKESTSQKQEHKTAKMVSSEHQRSPKSVLKKSFSTPDAAQLHRTAAEEAQVQQVLSGEKKRNKLGYHRTSVACSHCRRRKIRCIASPDAPNRCVNCIRLKKECSFYPPDQQQPGAEGQPKASSRQIGEPGASSTSSSPAVGAGSPADTPTAMGRVQRANMERFSLDANCNQYTFSSQALNDWASTDMNSSSSAKSEDMTIPWPAYPTESPVDGHYSQYTQPPYVALTWTSGASEAERHDEMNWGDYPAPMRSISYGGENGESQPQARFLSMAQAQGYDRRQSGMSDVYSHFPTTVAGASANHLNAPSQAVPGAAFSPEVNLWQTQQSVASQGQTAAWQYALPGASQAVMVDEHCGLPTVTQAPSGVYYST
ncbi:uncharacterized protein UV8b_02936 [Ustilaginoidea virens]|uniref:Zn(2)-C6 fungal-type domain-containing protein n=1 Tax=Ustilaginoidea virens TaxID=1159556 RepID=A0A8E5HNG6_USTVR|nr:uncharacterized protein UV8b_02936 [Ustilaginoidea virens]QUC18695.1 hypothetical protein UV8b_02936 [Ustilaginoidea virens]